MSGSFSVYWALGGRWLLNTVGVWAVDLVNRAPLLSAVVLCAVAVAKFVGAGVPLLVEYERMPGRHFWRALEWIGAGVLVMYGAVNVVVGWSVLGGVINSADGYNRSAELGHAALWDPLFLLWGLFLAAGLLYTRGARRDSQSPSAV